MLLLHQQKRDETVAIEYARDVEAFGKFLEPKYKDGSFTHLYDATPMDVLSYVDYLTRERKLRPGTILRKASFIRAFYQQEIRDKRRTDDPTQGVPLPARPERNAKRLPPKEIVQLFNAAREVPGVLGRRDYAILHALHSGLKKTEIVALRTRDYDRRKGSVQVGKGRSRRTLTLSADAAAAFNAYLDVRPRNTTDTFFVSRGKGVEGRQIWLRVKNLGKLAGLKEPLNPDSIRVSYAVNTLMEDPGQLLAIKKAFGHSSLHATQALAEMAFELKQAQEDPMALSGPSDDLLNSLDVRKAKRLWHNAKERLNADPEGAITLTRSLLESVAKTILKSVGEPSAGLELAPLCRRAILSVLPQSVVGRENFSKFAQSAANLVENVRGYRNVAGDAHGPIDDAEIERHHAEYAVSLAGATANFMLECYETWASRRATDGSQPDSAA